MNPGSLAAGKLRAWWRRGALIAGAVLVLSACGSGAGGAAEGEGASEGEGDPDHYRAASDMRRMREAGDPIALARARLVERGEDERRLAALETGAAEKVRAVRQRTAAVPAPDPSAALSDVFTTGTPDAVAVPGTVGSPDRTPAVTRAPTTGPPGGGRP